MSAAVAEQAQQSASEDNFDNEDDDTKSGDEDCLDEDTEEEIDVVNLNPGDEDDNSPAMQQHWRKRAVALCREMQEAELEKRKRLKLSNDVEIEPEVVVISEQGQEEEEEEEEESNKLITVSTVCLDSSKLPMISIIHEPDTDESSLQYVTKNGVFVGSKSKKVNPSMKRKLTPAEQDVNTFLLKKSSRPRVRYFPDEIPPRKNSKVPTVKEMLMAKRAGKPIPIPKEEMPMKLPKKPNPPSHGEIVKMKMAKKQPPKPRGDVLGHLACKTVHNTLEKFRRANMRQSFNKMQAFIPSICGNDRISKVRIIEEAKKYIKHLRQTYDQREILIQELTGAKYKSQIKLLRLKRILSKHKSAYEIEKILNESVPPEYQYEAMEMNETADSPSMVMIDEDEDDEEEVEELENEIMKSVNNIAQDLKKLTKEKEKINNRKKPQQQRAHKTAAAAEKQKRQQQQNPENSEKIELLIRTIQQMQQQIVQLKNNGSAATNSQALTQTEESSQAFATELKRLKARRESSSQIRSSTPPPPSNITPFFPRFSLPGGGSPPLINAQTNDHGEEHLTICDQEAIMPTANITQQSTAPATNSTSNSQKQSSEILTRTNDATTLLCYETLTQPPRLATSTSPSTSSTVKPQVAKPTTQLPLMQALANKTVTEIKEVMIAHTMPSSNVTRFNANQPNKLIKKTPKPKEPVPNANNTPFAMLGNPITINPAAVSAATKLPRSQNASGKPPYRYIPTLQAQSAYQPLTAINVSNADTRQLLPKFLQQLISTGQLAKVNSNSNTVNGSIQATAQPIPITMKNMQSIGTNKSQTATFKFVGLPNQVKITTNNANAGIAHPQSNLLKCIPIAGPTKVFTALAGGSSGLQAVYLSPGGQPKIDVKISKSKQFRILKGPVPASMGNTTVPKSAIDNAKPPINKTEIITIPFTNTQKKKMKMSVSLTPAINQSILANTTPTIRLNRSPKSTVQPKQTSIIISTSPTNEILQEKTQQQLAIPQLLASQAHQPKIQQLPNVEPS